MKGLKKFFENLFNGGKGAGVGRPDLRGAAPAQRPRPALPGPVKAPGREQFAPEAAYKKGDVIGGKYEVHSLLGKGGFGEVYLVYNRQLREPLALKTFRQKVVTDAAVKENFKREALLWLNLEEHPCILAARFVEEFYGRLFVAIDYIAPDDRGRVSLADHLARARGPLETDQALQWASMFCYGMEHANQRGIKSHRDIKPANILIRQEGTLLISDFGLAAAAESAWKRRGGSWESAGEEGFVGLSLFQTQGKQVCGTPGYLAPEIFRGEGADVRSDIYSFGLVLWQMAAGSQVPPFAVGVAPPHSPRDIDRYALEIYERQMRKRAPAVGEPLQGIIEHCLAAEPSERFANFAQLRVELEPILHCRTGRTVKLPPVGERSWVCWNNKGLSLHYLGRPEEAMACLRKGLEIDPNDKSLHNSLGLVLRAKGDLDGAVAEYRTALRLQPEDALAHNNLGVALLKRGDLDGAIAEFRTALRLQPSDARVHTNLGGALEAKGDLDGAIAECRTALRLLPDDAMAHNKLGSALEAKGDLDGAIVEYRTALRIEPDHAPAHTNLGIILAAKGNLDGAIAVYRTVLRLKPDDAKAHYNLGVALEDKDNRDDAIKEFRTAIRLQPDYAEAHIHLGAMLWKNGDRDGAIAEYRTTLRLQPDLVLAHNNLGNALRDKGNLEDAKVYYNIGAALEDKGDWDGAMAEYRTAVRLQPEAAEVHVGLGNALAAKGDLDGAVAEYRTALRLQPGLVLIHNNLGNMLAAKGDLDGAIVEYRTALRFLPDDASVHINLGSAIWKKGNLDGAITEYRTAVRLQPDAAEGHYNLALVLEDKGDREASLEEFRSAYKLAPNEPAIRQTYENLMRQLEH